MKKLPGKYIWFFFSLNLFVFLNSCHKPDSNPAFHYAETGDLDGFLEAIKNQVEKDIFNVEGKTPVHILAQKLYLERNDSISFSKLVSSGVSLDIEDKLGNTPLFYAAQSGNYYFCSELIQHGADVNHRNHKGKSSLFYAVSFLVKGPYYTNSLDLLKLFFLAGADINIKDNEGKNLIHVSKNPEVTRWLILHGVDFKHKDKYGKTPLDYFSADIFKARDKIIEKYRGKS